ncbi:YhgE/Pip family protein [Microbacterium excoecariae]|uniref:YhgE/Pip family protein n=1 Tax=Microbacterium excoecariae TaxID=2715210 RepID=UPI00140D21BE|nr:YhgE/Pip family protein [Microbacterium excoecariae]NHI16110.1 ABC transporter permease [Microbacterium excoecariae]
MRRIQTLVATELRRLTASPMATLALVALMIVPVIYAGLYLWGNDDPYGRLEEMPAALVVTDEGVTRDGDTTNYGAEVRDQLVEDGALEWHVTGAEEAADGLRAGAYDFVVTLGPDFSRHLASIDDDDPVQAEVELTTNDANSYLAGTIADTVTETVRAGLAREVGEEAARTLLDSVATIRSGLGDAADGANDLADGATAAASGAAELADGSATARTGADDLAAGLAELRDGSADLPEQTASLADGARQVADGNARLEDAVAPAAEAIGDAVSALPSEAKLRTDLEEAGLAGDEIDRVLELVAPLHDDIEAANTDVQAAAAAVAQLAVGSGAVADGASRLADGVPDLASGIAEAATGSETLASGVTSLASGSADLADGLDDLDAGSAELADGLADATRDIPDQTAEERQTAARMVADPVSVSEDATSAASSYGAGMAPFFISLAAWIGIYALFLIVKPYSARAVTALRRPLAITLGAWATPALLGIAQMLAVFAIVRFALGYDVARPAAMLAFLALTSATFAAIVLALNVLLGSVGQFLGLILMVLQLVTAGGTFPYQTLPAPLRILHEALPMSHAVDGIRQLMYGGDAGRAWAAAAFLGVWLAAALGVTLAALWRMTRTRTLRDLRPSLIG